MADCFIIKRNPTTNKRMDFDLWEHTTGTYGYSVDKNGWAGAFSSSTYIGMPNNLTYNNSFEIVINFMITTTPSKKGALFGSSNSYFYAPSLEIINANTIWAGFSYTGSSWAINFSTTVDLQLNKEYYLRYSYDGTLQKLKIELSDDAVSWNVLREQDNVAKGYQTTSGIFELGNVYSLESSVCHPFTFGKINLFKSYILTDGTLFWGVKYK